MRITDMMLTKVEQEKGVLPIQSSFTDMTYAVDRRNKVMWLIDRRTGGQIEIAAENVHAFAYELMDVVDLHITQKNMFAR